MLHDEQATATQEQAQSEPIATQTAQTTQTTPAPTEPTPMPAPATTESWLTKFPVYYKTPDPDGSLALSILKEGLEANTNLNSYNRVNMGIRYGYGYGDNHNDYSGRDVQQLSHISMLAMWASHILVEHPQYAEQWCEQLKSYNHRIVYIIYQMANTPQAKSCIAFQHTKDTIQSSLSIWDGKITVNAIWAGFYATGNPKYVHEIVDYLADYHKPHKFRYSDESYVAIATGLHMHVKKDTNIKQIADEYIQNLPKRNQKLLKHRAILSRQDVTDVKSYRWAELQDNVKILAQLPPEQKLAILTQ